MARLGETQYYKTSVNGIDQYTVLPYGGNVPYGYQPISKDQYTQGLQTKLAAAQQMVTQGKPQGYTGETFDQNSVNQYQHALSEVQSGQGAFATGYVDPQFSKYSADAPTPSEQYYTPEYRATLAPQEQQRLNQTYGQNNSISSVPAGMTQVKTGNTTTLMPTGSAGQQALANPVQQPTGIPSAGGATPAVPSPAGSSSSGSGGNPSPGGTASGGKTNASELARATQVFNNADQLAGTAGYEGKTADQIRASAHAYADSIRAGTTNFDPSTGGSVSGVPATNANGTVGTNSNGASNTTTDQKSIDAAYAIIDSSNLDPTTKAMYKDAVNVYMKNHAGQAADATKIIDTFNQMKAQTIDPEYAQAIAQQVDTTKRAADTLNQQRQLEVQQEQVSTKANTENAQQDLANRGMLFSGQAVKTLGTDSTFAQTGSPQAAASAIPTQDFAGLPLGTTQLQNKVATSSSALRYQNSLTDLERSAESNLGTAGSAGLVNGVTQLGGITGTLPKQQQSDYQSVLSGLNNNMDNNTIAQKPIDAFT